MNHTLDPPRTAIYWYLGVLPVQSWIAEARRSRDLLAGSRILALLMGDLLAALRDEGADLLLPHVIDGDIESLQGPLEDILERGSTAVPNRASGRLPGTVDSARILLASLDERLRERWTEVTSEIARSAQQSAGKLWDFVRPAVGRPECPFHLLWAVQDVSGSDDEGLRAVDRLYAAVKRSRPLRTHRGLPVRKCGQCGRREAMGGETPRDWRAFQRRLSALDEVRRGLRIDADEFLCPVCTLRRFAGYLSDQAFPSTSAIAARDWLRKVESAEDLRAVLQAHRDASKAVPGYEESWADRAPLYYRRSVERELRAARRDSDRAREEGLERVAQALTSLGQAIERHNRERRVERVPTAPAEYLAVLFFDGDDMGRRLRQDLQRLPSRVREFQNALASRLSSTETGPIGLGEPFYLGGDEGLILAPAASALAVATAIRELWQRVFGEGAEEGAAEPPTLSVGIAIFDRERPLGAAVAEARRELEAAKAMDGKNALAVSIQTASGSVWSVTGRWEDEWKRLAAAVELIRNGRLSAGWPHDVEAFLRTLPPEAFSAGEMARSAVREEVRRLTLRRLSGDRGEAAGSEESGTAVWDQLAGKAWWREEPPEQVLSTLPEQLHLVSFLVRQAGSA